MNRHFISQCYISGTVFVLTEMLIVILPNNENILKMFKTLIISLVTLLNKKCICRNLRKL